MRYYKVNQGIKVIDSLRGQSKHLFKKEVDRMTSDIFIEYISSVDNPEEFHSFLLSLSSEQILRIFKENDLYKIFESEAQRSKALSMLDVFSGILGTKRQEVNFLYATLKQPFVTFKKVNFISIFKKQFQISINYIPQYFYKFINRCDPDNFIASLRIINADEAGCFQDCDFMTTVLNKIDISRLEAFIKFYVDKLPIRSVDDLVYFCRYIKNSGTKVLLLSALQTKLHSLLKNDDDIIRVHDTLNQETQAQFLKLVDMSLNQYGDDSYLCAALETISQRDNKRQKHSRALLSIDTPNNAVIEPSCLLGDQENKTLIKTAIDIIEMRKTNVSLRDLFQQGLSVNALYEKKPLFYWAVIQKVHYDWRETDNEKTLELDRVVENVNILYENGADINWRDDKGNTYLHLAKELVIVRLLLSFDLDPYIQNKEGVLPHNKDRFNDRTIAFFEIGMDMSYLSLGDNVSLGNHHLLRHLLYVCKKKISAEHLDRALDLWLPAAKILIEAGAPLDQKNTQDMLPLQKCVNKIKISATYRDMWAHKEDGFKKLDEKIQGNAYFKFAKYLYEKGTFSRFKDKMFFNDVFFTPLMLLDKNDTYLGSQRVIEHLAHYEAAALGIDAPQYKAFLNKVLDGNFTERSVYNYFTLPHQYFVKKCWQEIGVFDMASLASNDSPLGIVEIVDAKDAAPVKAKKSTLSRVNHILNSADDLFCRQSIDVPLRCDLKTRATSALIMDLPLPKRKNTYKVLFKFSDEKLNEQASQDAKLNLKL